MFLHVISFALFFGFVAKIVVAFYIIFFFFAFLQPFCLYFTLSIASVVDMKRLDELDLKILDELSENAGISIPRLAKKLGVKQSKVYSRVKRLLRRGVIKRLTIEANEEALGLNVQAFIGINVESLEREKVVEEIVKVPEVVSVSEVTGRFDLFVEAHVKSLEDLYSVVSKKIAILPGVSHTETFIQLKRRQSLRKFSLLK